MPSAKPLSKEQILAAMSQTLSNKAAARYLHVSYIHYKRWAKTYDATESLVRYTKNLENGGYMAKDLYVMARECECPDGENEISKIVNHMFKSAWMMKSTLRTS